MRSVVDFLQNFSGRPRVGMASKPEEGEDRTATSSPTSTRALSSSPASLASPSVSSASTPCASPSLSLSPPPSSPPISRTLGGKADWWSPETLGCQGLPIVSHKQDIIRAVRQERIVVLHAEVGAGKSSMTPCLLMEMNPEKNLVMVSQPRRIAAKSLFDRMKSTLSPRSELVGLRLGGGIKDEKKASCCVRYVTTGYLVRLLANNPSSLDRHTHLVLDEVHERSVDMDVLCLLAKNMLRTNPTIRLVLMSATLQAKVLSKYFGLTHPPIFVGARRFPVKTLYLEDYLCKLYEDKGKRSPKFKFSRDDPSQTKQPQYDVCVELIRFLVTQSSSAILVFVSGISDIEQLNERLESLNRKRKKRLYHCVAIHSSIPLEQQEMAWKDCPNKESIKVILATNSAESSITLPDVDTVVCFGTRKLLKYDNRMNCSVLQECWISAASATQRAGRTGRVRPGSVYALYPQELLSEEFDEPEILTSPLSAVLLTMKSIVSGGPVLPLMKKLIDYPPKKDCQNGLARLFEIGLLSSVDDNDSFLTPLGLFALKLPVDFEFAKFLALGAQLDCFAEAIALVTVLSCDQPYLYASSTYHREEEYNSISSKVFLAKRAMSDGVVSEPFLILRLLSTWLQLGTEDAKRAFIKRNALSWRRMVRLVSVYNDLKRVILQLVDYAVNFEPFLEALLIDPRRLNRLQLLLVLWKPGNTVRIEATKPALSGLQNCDLLDPDEEFVCVNEVTASDEHQSKCKVRNVQLKSVFGEHKFLVKNLSLREVKFKYPRNLSLDKLMSVLLKSVLDPSQVEKRICDGGTPAPVEGPKVPLIKPKVRQGRNKREKPAPTERPWAVAWQYSVDDYYFPVSKADTLLRSLPYFIDEAPVVFSTEEVVCYHISSLEKDRLMNEWVSPFAIPFGEFRSGVVLAHNWVMEKNYITFLFDSGPVPDIRVRFSKQSLAIKPVGIQLLLACRRMWKKAILLRGETEESVVTLSPDFGEMSLSVRALPWTCTALRKTNTIVLQDRELAALEAFNFPVTCAIAGDVVITRNSGRVGSVSFLPGFDWLKLALACAGEDVDLNVDVMQQVEEIIDAFNESGDVDDMKDLLVVNEKLVSLVDELFKIHVPVLSPEEFEALKRKAALEMKALNSTEREEQILISLRAWIVKNCGQDCSVKLVQNEFCKQNPTAKSFFGTCKALKSVKWFKGGLKRVGNKIRVGKNEREEFTDEVASKFAGSEQDMEDSIHSLEESDIDSTDKNLGQALSQARENVHEDVPVSESDIGSTDDELEHILLSTKKAKEEMLTPDDDCSSPDRDSVLLLSTKKAKKEKLTRADNDSSADRDDVLLLSTKTAKKVKSTSITSVVAGLRTWLLENYAGECKLEEVDMFFQGNAAARTVCADLQFTSAQTLVRHLSNKPKYKGYITLIDDCKVRVCEGDDAVRKVLSSLCDWVAKNYAKDCPWRDIYKFCEEHPRAKSVFLPSLSKLKSRINALLKKHQGYLRIEGGRLCLVNQRPSVQTLSELEALVLMRDWIAAKYGLECKTQDLDLFYQQNPAAKDVFGDSKRRMKLIFKQYDGYLEKEGGVIRLSQNEGECTSKEIAQDTHEIEALKTLCNWTISRHGDILECHSIGQFYREKPQLKSTLKGKLGKLILKHQGYMEPLECSSSYRVLTASPPTKKELRALSALCNWIMDKNGWEIQRHQLVEFCKLNQTLTPARLDMLVEKGHSRELERDYTRDVYYIKYSHSTSEEENALKMLRNWIVARHHGECDAAILDEFYVNNPSERMILKDSLPQIAARYPGIIQLTVRAVGI